jgi:hypothetical protein
MKDKDDRVQGNPQFSGGGRQQAGANPYAQNPNAVLILACSRLPVSTLRTFRIRRTLTTTSLLTGRA